MKSTYKSRFCIEYSMLLSKIKRLQNFIDKYERGVLDVKPKSPLELYRIQLSAMFTYLQILGMRSTIEEIDLSQCV